MTVMTPDVIFKMMKQGRKGAGTCEIPPSPERHRIQYLIGVLEYFGKTCEGGPQTS